VPGDIVEVDTLDVRPLPGVILKHFTAHDVISRWDVVSVHSRATASTAAHFLDTLERRMPFPVRAIQVDGGSEFEAIFEEECQRRGIKLFVLPPRSLKLNGGVERAHRTHSEEFYEVTESSFDLSELKDELLQWERVYNTVRPHQALGYLTPLKFLEQRKDYKREEVMCHQSYERVHGIASYLSRCYNWTSHWQIFGKEDNPMPTYIMLMKLTEQGVKDIKNAPQRVEQAAKTAEAIGGKMIGFYATMGEYDYVVIGECPSDEVMMTFLMGLGSLGSVRTTTLKAFTREEFAQLVKRLP